MKRILRLTVLLLPLLLRGQTQTYLDANNVKALILNRNDMFWNPATGQPQYEVPKGSGKHMNFLGSLWLGGIDAGGQLYTGAMTYRQSGFDFFPGPLDTVAGIITQSVSAAFDKIWKVSRSEIDAFKIAWAAGSVTANTYTVPPDILSWPGNGNTSAGYAKQLAPYVDVNNNGVYNPAGEGDYPLIKGDQMVYYICNDNEDIHTETQGVPLRVELHVSAYSYSCANALASSPPLNYATFHHYKLINRSATTYNNMFLSILCDGGSGDPTDDYLGCDTMNRIAYLYNSTGSDNVYQNTPPILSYQVLRGPLANTNDGVDNDADGTTDEPGEQCTFNRVMFWNNNLSTVKPATSNPQIAVHYYNYMDSRWKDSRRLQADSMGYLDQANTTQSTMFAFPGDPQTSAGWTEFSRNNAAGDRRFLLSNGPFTLGAGETEELEYSILTTFDSTSGGYKNISKVRSQNASLRNFYNLQLGCSATNTTVTGLDDRVNLSTAFVLLPNPAGNEVTVRLGTSSKTAAVIFYNNLGDEVIQLEIQENSPAIDISALASGIYYVVVKEPGGIFARKLLKD